MSHSLNEDFLFEIGTEELPPKSLQALEQSLVHNIAQGLEKAGLNYSAIKGFSTPRRLACLVSKLAAQQPDRIIKKRGPAKNASLDANGNPGKALLGFASSCGVSVKDLKVESTDKGDWYVFEETMPGKSVKEVLPELIHSALGSLPLPKRMRWGNREEVFVRPVHWTILLYGSQIIPAEIFGCQSQNQTRGHRFHHPEPISLEQPAEYPKALLEKGMVLADFQSRRDFILQEILRHAKSHHARIDTQDSELLNEVTGLTEWPVILVGEFDQEFLKVPKEALISAMKVHQRCFPLEDNQQGLLPKFIIISNIESKEPIAVIRGNESVVRARLADAVFHFDSDKKTSLESRTSGLKQVVFQQGLSTLWDKSLRIKNIALELASLLETSKESTFENSDLNKKSPSLRFTVERSALLSKADLLTQMVGEFPELQGIMGRYYALNDNEHESVARAIEEHYLPRFANDKIPATLAGAIIAIADRADTLVGLFSLGKRPTGDKDPFGLRRQAMGILRIVIEMEIEELDLETLFSIVYGKYGDLLRENPIRELIGFCFERLRAWYIDRGVPAKVFESVVARQPTKPLDFHRRILAVQAFQKLPEAESLSAANKRVQNILSKSEIPIPPGADFDPSLLIESSEKTLACIIQDQEKALPPLILQSRYTEALKSLAALKDPIDQFFDSVMVMVENPALRNNRLKLLNRLRALFLEIADISLL